MMDILGELVTLPRVVSDQDPNPFPVQFHVAISPPCIHKCVPRTTAVASHEFQISFCNPKLKYYAYNYGTRDDGRSR